MFLVQFKRLEDQLQAINKGVYYFAPFIVKLWNTEMEIYTEEIASLPIWVQLPSLDIKYWGNASLSKIGNVLGIPLKTDKYTRDKSMLKYARVLIDIPLNGGFPDHIDFANDKGVMVRQAVAYEWQPIKCSHCSMFSHVVDQCRKKQPIRQEWRPVSEPAPPCTDQNGFQAAPTRQKASRQEAAAASPA